MGFTIKDRVSEDDDLTVNTSVCDMEEAMSSIKDQYRSWIENRKFPRLVEQSDEKDN